MSLWNREPALILGALQSIIALAVSFGLSLTVEQTGAILAASAALLAVITRSQVSPAPKPPSSGSGDGGAPVHVHLELPEDRETPPDPPRSRLVGLVVACLLVAGCGLFGGGAANAEPCSFENAAYSAKVLECDAKIGECPKRDDGTPQEDCPALVECERWLAEVCQQ